MSKVVWKASQRAKKNFRMIILYFSVITKCSETFFSSLWLRVGSLSLDRAIIGKAPSEYRAHKCKRAGSAVEAALNRWAILVFSVGRSCSSLIQLRWRRAAVHRRRNENQCEHTHNTASHRAEPIT